MAGGKAKDERGNRYGRLVVIEQVSKPPDQWTLGAYWLCQCDCGKKTIANGMSMRKGGKGSCGCLQDEARKQRGKY